MYARNVVVAPTAITCPELAGEPTVPAVPASPVLVTTVTPAAIAALSARLIGSSAVSGNGLPPNDSLSTSAPSLTAYSMAWMNREVGAELELPKTFRPIRLAPGAMPTIRMLQPGGSGCAGFTKLDRS